MKAFILRIALPLLLLAALLPAQAQAQNSFTDADAEPYADILHAYFTYYFIAVQDPQGQGAFAAELRGLVWGLEDVVGYILVTNPHWNMILQRFQRETDPTTRAVSSTVLGIIAEKQATKLTGLAKLDLEKDLRELDSVKGFMHRLYVAAREIGGSLLSTRLSVWCTDLQKLISDMAAGDFPPSRLLQGNILSMHDLEAAALAYRLIATHSSLTDRMAFLQGRADLMDRVRARIEAVTAHRHPDHLDAQARDGFIREALALGGELELLRANLLERPSNGEASVAWEIADLSTSLIDQLLATQDALKEALQRAQGRLYWIDERTGDPTKARERAEAYTIAVAADLKQAQTSFAEVPKPLQRLQQWGDPKKPLLPPTISATVTAVQTHLAGAHPYAGFVAATARIDQIARQIAGATPLEAAEVAELIAAASTQEGPIPMATTVQNTTLATALAAVRAQCVETYRCDFGPAIGSVEANLARLSGRR